MRYYIKNGISWQELEVEIEPKYVKAFDTTNDTLSCVLKANDEKDAYKPMTPFKVEETVGNSTETTILWIINDTVDIFSLKPLKYKHSLTIVQYRYFLNKHLIRNTVFNQPRKNKVQLYGAVSNYLAVNGNPNNGWQFYFRHLAKAEYNSTRNLPNYWSDKLFLNGHTKIKNFSYKIKLFIGYLNHTGMGDVSGKMIESDALNNRYVSFTNDCYFELVDLQNNNYSLGKFYINEAALSGVTVSQAMLDTIRAYIAEHANAVLAFKYWKDGVDPEQGYYSDIDFRFVTNSESYIPNSTDPGVVVPPEYLEATAIRFVTCQIFINLEIYNYTMFDILDTLLKQHRLYSSTYGNKREQLFNLPPVNSDLWQLLNSTYPKDTLSFTQATFYDALTEIFRYYDAGFKFDEDKTLQIEYYNNPSSEITPNFVGRQVSHSDRDYNNGRVINYQNAILSVKLPRLTVRSQSFGVPDQNDFGILLEKPIYNIDKLEVDVWGKLTIPTYVDTDMNKYFIFERTKLDITQFILNESEWMALNKADPGGYYNDDLTIKYQVTNLHFTRGGNFINLSETYQDVYNFTQYVFDNVLKIAASRFIGYGETVEGVEPNKIQYPEDNTYTQMVFGIEYQIMNNGRSEVQTATMKYDGKQIVNQSDGLIDLNKVGLNMLGESLKEGEPVLTANCIITNWADRVKEGDYFVDDRGFYWVANVVNYTEISSGKYRCSIEFSKNFNALSLKVNSDKEKRLTNVSSENAILSEDNIIDYIYIYNPNDDTEYSGDSTVLNQNVLASMISQTFKFGALNNIKDIKFASLTSFTLSNNQIYYGISSGNELKAAKNRYMPLLKYGLGNCICFEAQFKDALSAGSQLTITSGWFGTNKFFSAAALYTDDEGWADVFDLAFCDLTSDGEVNNIGNFPVIESSTYNQYIQEVGKLLKVKYYKKPNEIFALNYEWCFLITKNNLNKLFVGNKFINENIFTNRDIIANKTFKIRYINSSSSSEEKYTILDTKGIGNSTATITDINVITDSANHKLTVCFKTNSSFQAKIWAVVDENNDIYFASNDPATFSSSSFNMHLGFLLRSTRNDL